MQTNKGRFLRREISVDNRYRLARLILNAVCINTAQTVFCRQISVGDAFDDFFTLTTVLNQFLHRDNLQLELVRHFYQRVAFGAIPSVVQDFGEETGGEEPRESAEIDGRFRMTRAAQNAALFGFKGEDMAGTRKIGRLRLRIGERTDRHRFFRRRDSRFCVDMIDGDGERRAKTRGVMLNHLRQFESPTCFREQRNARLTATVPQHKIDVFRRNFFRGADEVALVFAVFVVDDDDDFALFERVDRFFDRIELVFHNDISF